MKSEKLFSNYRHLMTAEKNHVKVFLHGNYCVSPRSDQFHISHGKYRYRGMRTNFLSAVFKTTIKSNTKTRKHM